MIRLPEPLALSQLKPAVLNATKAYSKRINAAYGQDILYQALAKTYSTLEIKLGKPENMPMCNILAHFLPTEECLKNTQEKDLKIVFYHKNNPKSNPTDEVEEKFSVITIDLPMIAYQTGDEEGLMTLKNLYEQYLKTELQG